MACSSSANLGPFCKQEKERALLFLQAMRVGRQRRPPNGPEMMQTATKLIWPPTKPTKPRATSLRAADQRPEVTQRRAGGTQLRRAKLFHCGL